MKKKYWITGLVALAVLAVLFLPVPSGSDGDTREYRALTYRVVRWERSTDVGVYEKTRFYGPGDRDTPIDELWEREGIPAKFVATVVELTDTTALVEPMEWEPERDSCDRISFSIVSLPEIGVEVGSVVELVYPGQIRETYPASIDVSDWSHSKDLRHMAYPGTWLDKTTAQPYDSSIFSDIVITEVYADCFFARPVIPMPYTIKLNGVLPGKWCVGDQIVTTHENVYYDPEHDRVEADMLTVEASDFQPDPNACYKPVIYLYPPEETQVSVTLAPEGGLTCTYPKYDGGWTVTAAPDGTLTDARGQTYNYLYWEGQTYARYDMTQGFCVKGEDTAAFLEEALAKLGLTRKEANEFIVYWLPLMEGSPYNLISFQQEAYTDAAKLEISPAPDTLIRVFMTWQGSQEYVELPEQPLTAPEREGFTVVEWGGTQLTAG